MGATLAGGIYRNAAPLNELSPRTLVLVAASDTAERLEWESTRRLSRPAKSCWPTATSTGPCRAWRATSIQDWLEVLCESAPHPDLIFLFQDEAIAV